MQTFWVVWCPSGGPPRKRYDFEPDAVREAARLANQEPGTEFFVLRSTHHVKRTDVTITKVDDPLPF